MSLYATQSIHIKYNDSLECFFLDIFSSCSTEFSIINKFFFDFSDFLHKFARMIWKKDHSNETHTSENRNWRVDVVYQFWIFHLRLWNQIELPGNVKRNKTDTKHSMFDFIAYPWYILLAIVCKHTNKSNKACCFPSHDGGSHRILQNICHSLWWQMIYLSVVSSLFNRNICISKCFFLLHSHRKRNVYFLFSNFAISAFFLFSFIVYWYALNRKLAIVPLIH